MRWCICGLRGRSRRGRGGWKGGVQRGEWGRGGGWGGLQGFFGAGHACGCGCGCVEVVVGGLGCSDLGIDRVRSTGCLWRMARCVWDR